MDSTPGQSNDLASQYALRVALQTMKERCISLQRRLISVEEENQQLRERFDEGATDAAATQANGTGGDAAEVFQLQLQVAELHRQKSQLNEHINMVSNENRKLWSRLSQIAKEQGKTSPISDDNDCTLVNETETECGSASSAAAAANQNLIRSKTFTQHSPNPHLRHKLISTGNGDKDISMEEVILDTYVADGGMTRAVEEYAATPVEVEIGFAYLNVDENAASASDADEADFNLEAKKCIEGLQEIRHETLKQQHELNSALAMLESRIALQPCSECAKKSQKPEMADKSLETDESLSEIKFYNNSQIIQEPAAHKFPVEPANVALPHLNIIEEKLKADSMDKMCPMCGKVYGSLVTFEAFQQHVEMHFVDLSGDVETSMERNFEFISHAVGDF